MIRSNELENENVMIYLYLIISYLWPTSHFGFFFLSNFIDNFILLV